MRRVGVRPLSALFRAITYLALVCHLASCQPASQPTGTAITNVTVIDAVNGVRSNHTVVYDGDEIVSVGPGGAPADVAETIDGSGKYLIPGLWDFHVHLSFDERLTDDMPALFLSYGVTSVRDTGGLMRQDAAHRRENARAGRSCAAGLVRWPAARR